ncbi:aminomethyl transferase family protein, partial [Mesorhizobium sp. M7A.F.Ca.US.006.01.1.1]
MMETSLAERRSPFYSSIVGLGATMGRVGGDFISAKTYSGIADEHLNTRKNVGVQDL